MFEFTRQKMCFLFERSEFLIDASQKNFRACVRLIILVSRGSLKRYCYRCVCTTRIMYQIRMYLVSCKKHSMVVYIHEPYPWAQSVLARRYMEVTSWRPGAVDCTVWNEHHRTRLACRRPGPGAHRDIERGKVPSAARVACIARSACTSLDQNLVRGLPLRVGERPMRHVRWGTCL